MNKKPDHKECNPSINLPYPPIKAESQQLDYAYAMLNNIGGNNSEMTTISLYFYNSIILKPDYPEFANCFHKISIVEMHHLNIFATLAFQMGLDPRLWSRKKQRTYYWTPSYNNYSRQIHNVLENSIKEEQNAVQRYTHQAQTISDINIVENLNRIILDEQKHIEIFNIMLENIK